MKPYNHTIENAALARRATEAAHSAHSSKRNWLAARACSKVVQLGDVEVDAFQYRGRYKGYPGSNFVPVYTSFLRIENRFQATYTCGFAGEMKSRNLRAPVGMEWDHDGSIIAFDLRVEYHPTSDDLLARDFGARVRRALAEARKYRAEVDARIRENEMEQRRYDDQSDNVMVTLADSRRAGNCVEGSLRFAECKLRVDREMVLNAAHLFMVPAFRLRSVANGERMMVERAVRCAWERETAVQI
jgi:hypothetical protein